MLTLSIMHNYLRETKRKLLLINVLLLLVFPGEAQINQNGMRKGMIKVKFSPEVINTLSNTPINASNKRLITGIASVDAVAQKISATNMYRLFPYDAKNESKLQKQGLHLWYVVEVNEAADTERAVQEFKQLKEVVTATKIIDSMDSMIAQLNHSAARPPEKVNTKRTK